MHSLLIRSRDAVTASTAANATLISRLQAFPVRFSFVSQLSNYSDAFYLQTISDTTALTAGITTCPVVPNSDAVSHYRRDNWYIKCLVISLLALHAVIDQESWFQVAVVWYSRYHAILSANLSPGFFARLMDTAHQIAITYSIYSYLVTFYGHVEQAEIMNL